LRFDTFNWETSETASPRKHHQVLMGKKSGIISIGLTKKAPFLKSPTSDFEVDCDTRCKPIESKVHNFSLQLFLILAKNPKILVGITPASLEFGQFSIPWIGAIKVEVV